MFGTVLLPCIAKTTVQEVSVEFLFGSFLFVNFLQLVLLSINIVWIAILPTWISWMRR